MGEHLTTPWLREGRLIYTLEQDGWRRGAPVMVNRFMVTVSGGHPRPADAELDAVASLVHAAPDLLEAGRALYAAIGDWRKPENGFLTPDLIAAGVKWCAAIAKAESRTPQTQGGV